MNIVAPIMTEAGTIAFSAINRSPDESLSLDIDLQGFGASRLIEHRMLSHPDPKAANTAGRPDEAARLTVRA